ncbi:hypothetical protein D3C78_1225010 [compost metagenome]
MAVDYGIPLLFGNLLDHVVPGEAGVVDDDVDAAEGIQSSLHATVTEVGGGHVAQAGDGIAAESTDFRDHFIGRSLIEVVDHDLGAFFGEFQRDGAADAAAGTGNDGDFALQSTHGMTPVVWFGRRGRARRGRKKLDQFLPYMVTTQAPPRPRLCCKAMFTPSTWRLSAVPRSWWVSS